MKKIYFFFLVLFVFPTWSEGEAAVSVLKIRHGSGTDFTRVVIDLGGRVRYQDQSVPGSETLSIRIHGVSLPGGKSETAIQDQAVRAVTIAPGGKESAEIRIALAKPTRYKIFTLAPAGEKPDRLVIDVFRTGTEPAEKIAKTSSPSPPPSPAEKPREVAETPAKKPDAAESAGIPENGKEAGAEISKLLEIRQWTAPDHTRVVVDLKGAPSFEVLPSSDPLVFGILLHRTVLRKERHEISVNDQVIRKMTVEPAGKDRVRILLSLIKPGRTNIFSLKPFGDKPDRLVLDVFRPDLEEREKAERRDIQDRKAKKTRIIVIDPGHGGEDPGAIGPNGTREKDVVFAVARRLQKSLHETGEFKAVLTRRGDYYVSLQDRVKIAMEYGADLFVSLHANGNPSRQVRGASVYCLSSHGDSDQIAQMLAQKENAADFVGGTLAGPARKDLDSILLDLEMTRTINDSLQFGGVMLGELKRVNQIQLAKPRQARFAVLRAPSFPSILVELAHITHPVEEKALLNESYQTRAANAIAEGIRKFMPILTGKEASGGGEMNPAGGMRKGG